MLEEVDIAPEEERPASLLARIGLAAVLVAVLIVAVYALLHMSVRPINPAQETPTGHFMWNCAVCHDVNPKAPLLKK
jgi:hypothetical protein